MALDKLVDSTQLDTGLTAVANAIRTKGGTSAQLAFPAGFVSAVEAIETGGGEKQYGLITEIDITSAVSEIRYTLPDLVLSDHLLYVVIDNLTMSAEDWLYATVAKEGSYISGIGNYSAKAASINGLKAEFLFSEAKDILAESFDGFVAGVMNTTGGGRMNTRIWSQALTQFGVAPYAAGTVITGGTIRLYGRIA
jgi:hypothetical protein